MNTSNLTPTKLVVSVLLAIMVFALFFHWLSLSAKNNSMPSEQSHTKFTTPPAHVVPHNNTQKIMTGFLTRHE